MTIDIIVATDGSTRLETTGFQGATCRDASRFLERALGTSAGETLKAEFHQSATEHGTTHHRQ
ncbi:MAG: DUF2997 domain-containing protein [Pirellulales bacterium]